VNDMDINAITGFISQLGVPVALLIAMFWLLDKERSDHKEEMKNLTTAINNNTIALTKLIERMDVNEQSNLDRS
jgi:hypothetical protein